MAATLSAEKWKTFFDTDGRLVDELGLRKTIFSCDIDPAIRPEVWRFLYGLYPANSTHRERKAIDLENLARYTALKARWRILDVAVGNDYVPSHDLFYLDGQEEETDGSKRVETETDKERAEDGTLLKMLDITARLYATKQDVDLTEYVAAKRLVLKDVVRTDRDHPFFKINENLRKVHHVLLVYAMFHPELNYLQGYNDITARFLVVLESEVDCYWVFKLYVEKRKDDFSETGMIHRTQLVCGLMGEMDSELHQCIMEGECSHFLFCHRWLLLNFKREFSMEDGIRMFEVLSSQYLELSSDEALRAKHKAVAVEFLAEEGGLEVEAAGPNLEYTFDVFLCVAILTKHRDNLLKADGAVELIGYINSLSHKMVVSEVLEAAQALVYKYCKLSVKKGFHLVNADTAGIQ